MGGRLRRFKTPPLINRDIDQDSPVFHKTKHVARDQLWRGGPWNEDGADDHIGVLDEFFQNSWR